MEDKNSCRGKENLEGYDTLLPALFSELSTHENGEDELLTDTVHDEEVHPDVLEPYRRWREEYAHHKIVEAQMAEFFAEFSDIAHDAIDSDIVYTELKRYEHHAGESARDHRALLVFIVVMMLLFMGWASWFVYKTDEGIHVLQAQLVQLNHQAASAPMITAEKLPAVSVAADAADAAEQQPPVVEKAKVVPPAATVHDAYAAHIRPVADRTAGQWVINVSSHLSREQAEQAAQVLLRDLSMTCMVREVLVRGKTWYRVTLEGFTLDAARTFLKEHKHDLAFEGAWVGKKN